MYLETFPLPFSPAWAEGHPSVGSSAYLPRAGTLFPLAAMRGLLLRVVPFLPLESEQDSMSNRPPPEFSDESVLSTPPPARKRKPRPSPLSFYWH